MAHEMRGMLLVVLLFMLSDEEKSTLEKRVGDTVLAAYIHLFELTILFECWLDRDEFMTYELELANKFIPVLINTFVTNVT